MSRDTGPLRVERLSTVDELLTLEGQWRQLFDASEVGLFNAWEWLVPWWRHLGRNRDLWVLVARDDAGRARGIVPMSLGNARIGFIKIRRLSFLGDDRVGSDYLDVIAVPQWRPAVLRALADYLLRHERDWDLLEWQDMDSRSDSASRLAACLGPYYRVEQTLGLACPGQQLSAGESFDEFLSRSRRARNYRRRLCWLERQPGFRVEICDGERGLEQARAIFFRLHDKRWAGEGGSTGIPNEQVQSFHADATQRLAERGQVIFYTLWVGDVPVASVYALISGTTFYYYQAGMDPAWRSRSVGLVLIGKTVEDAIRRGMERFDFLRGEESYKFDWVNESRQLVRWRIYSHRGRGLLACRIDAGIRAAKRRIKSLVS